MTLPYERTNAIQNTELFLMELMDPKKTPRVPKEIRRRARSLLKHYPGQFYIGLVSDKVPEAFGPPRDNIKEYWDAYNEQI